MSDQEEYWLEIMYRSDQSQAICMSVFDCGLWPKGTWIDLAALSSEFMSFFFLLSFFFGGGGRLEDCLGCLQRPWNSMAFAILIALLVTLLYRNPPVLATPNVNNIGGGQGT